MRAGSFSGFLFFLAWASVTTAGEHRPRARVTAATRIDWTFALANQSLSTPPDDWLPGYDSTAQTYELYVPREVPQDKPAGLIVFISPSPQALGFNEFRKVCDEKHLLFASPIQAGNDAPMPKRVRLVLDVLDDIRRQYPIDADRTYIGGFSGGGRVACAIGFALPEYFGGVIPVCAAGDLREESWLRHRVIDRLSVAHLTGDGDFNRGEVERFRGPMLTDVGVRAKVWVAPQTGHSLPATTVIKDAVHWLEKDVDARRKFAKEYSASRVNHDAEPTREQSASMLLAEGKRRIEKDQTLYSGLMQLQGIMHRWPDLSQAEQAKTILLEYESRAERPWEQDDIDEQRRFLVARARGVSDYASGELPDQYRPQRADMLAAAIELWNQVLSDGQNTKAVAEGKKRLPELKRLAAEQK